MPVFSDIKINPKNKMFLKLDGSQGDTLANSGTLRNQKANSYQDALITGSPLRINGVSDDALQFNSADDLVTIQNHSAMKVGAKSFALNMYLQLDPDASHMILDARDAQGTGYSLENINGDLRLTLQDQAGNSKIFEVDASQFETNDWKMLTVNVKRSNKDSNNLKVEFLVSEGENGLTERISAPITDTFSAIKSSNASLDNNADVRIGSSTNDAFSLDNIRLVNGIINTKSAERLYRAETNELSPTRSAHWTLDEMGINNQPLNFAADSSGNSDLTRVNNPSIVQGPVDHAVRFNGSQSLTASNNSSINFGVSDITFAAWIQSEDQNSVILEKVQVLPNQNEKGYSLNIENNRIGLQLADGINNDVRFELTDQQSAQILNNQWNHVTVTVERDSSSVQQVKFLVNGELITDTPLVSVNGAAPVSMANPVSMGNINNIADLVIGENLAGSLDEIQMFKSELSQFEIAQLVAPIELVYGTDSNDIAKGVFKGSGAAEMLIGGLGNDVLQAIKGNDVLIGVNHNQVNPGIGEIDNLIGGTKAGADTFVLGSANEAFYKGQGSQDYAVIQNLNIAQNDKISLYGDASLYEINQIIENNQVVGSSISLKDSVDPQNNPSDLIAQVQGVDLTVPGMMEQVAIFS